MSIVFAPLPIRVAAAELETPYSPIIVTELSPGTAISGSQEFIELYNQSGRAIDLSKEKWEVQIASSLAKDWSRAKQVVLAGIFYPGTYYLLASSYVAAGETEPYLHRSASSVFASGMTGSSGHVRLMRGSTVLDAVEWSTSKDAQLVSAPIEALPVLSLDTALASTESIKRIIRADGSFAVTDEVFTVSACPSPTATNREDHAVIVTDKTVLPLATTIDVTDQQCRTSEEPEEESPIPQASTEPLAILLPPATPVIPTPQKQRSIPAADVGLAAPQLTELLPNPASPQTDAEDEYIELYNPNDSSYDLSGFMLYASGTKKYTFPEGTMLAPRSFKAFFSADTHLSLSNATGQVRLVDPLDREIGVSEVYNAAKDNQAWVRVNGSWHWTTVLTPNAANVLQTPAVVGEKASRRTQKSTVVATKQTTSPAKKVSEPVTQHAATVIDKAPVHPWVLAGVGGLALLYGAYEYRRDMANKFYQLRSNRAARRAHRARAEGR